MRAGQNDGRCNARCQRFFPAQSAQAPAVIGLEAGEPMLGPGGDEVITLLQRMRQKSLRHPRTNHVGAHVILIGVATAVPKITGEWIVGARHQGGAQHVQGLS